MVKNRTGSRDLILRVWKGGQKVAVGGWRAILTNDLSREVRSDKRAISKFVLAPRQGLSELANMTGPQPIRSIAPHDFLPPFMAGSDGKSNPG